jgi:hypothetical protein
VSSEADLIEAMMSITVIPTEEEYMRRRRG